MAKKQITDAEEDRIQKMIASDPDNPEWTPKDFDKARPFADVFPALAEKMRKAGRPNSANPKVAVSIRLDQDVIEAFKSGGPGWQSRMNDALRHAAHLRSK